MHQKVIALATGGTGGHVFPAQALAEELLKRGHKVIIICDQRTESLLELKSKNVEIMKIYAPQPTKNPLKLAANFAKLIPVIFNLKKYLKLHNVSAIVGFGGYPTVPLLTVGLLLRIRLYLHEQNTVLGRVNRLFSRFVNRIFASFPNTKLVPESIQERVQVVGNLVRECVARNQTSKPDDGYFRILAIGGSQGAKVISEVVPDAISSLPKNVQKKIILHQQVRKGMQDAVYRELDKLHIHKFEVAPFFEDIGKIMNEADLVISRSGASIVTELMLVGKPSILVPYKFATDDHQYYNAQYLVKKNAAVMIQEEMLTPEILTYKIANFIKHPEKLEKMANKAKLLAKPDAAKNVADILEADLWQEK